VSSDELHYLSWREIADGIGVEFDREKNHLLRGKSRLESLRIITDGQMSIDSVEETLLTGEKNRIFLDLARKAGKKMILPGAVRYLARAKALGFRISVASASKNCREIMRLSGLGKCRFDAIVDGNDIKKSKPDPEIFLIAAERMGVPPELCVVFEDAQSGIDGAKAAGMSAVGVGPADLTGCDHRAKTIADCPFDALFPRRE
jgi:beta-phosphoglucomutase